MNTSKNITKSITWEELLRDSLSFKSDELDTFLYDSENRNESSFANKHKELYTGKVSLKKLKSKIKERIQSRGEELVNTITHAAGVLLILVFFPLLIIEPFKVSDHLMLWSVSIFGFGMLMAYMASTLYHFVQKEKAKRKLRTWDHIGIFLLIGGTYTPIVCKYTNGTTAIYFLSTMWSMIAAGSILKLFFTGKYDRLSTIIYLFLGWMAVFIIQPLKQTMPLDVFLWILGGGLMYTLGVIFYRWHSLKYHHGIWHLFVLAGTILQFIAIYKSV